MNQMETPTSGTGRKPTVPEFPHRRKPVKIDLSASPEVREKQFARAQKAIEGGRQFSETVVGALLEDEENFEKFETIASDRLTSIKDRADVQGITTEQVDRLREELVGIRNVLSSKYRLFGEILNKVLRGITHRKQFELVRREHEQRGKEEEEAKSFFGTLKRMFILTPEMAATTGKRGKEVILSHVADPQESQAADIRDRMDRISHLLEEATQGMDYLRSKKQN